MNFKPELVEKILAGAKTQTRRPAKACEMLDDQQGIVHYFRNDGPDTARYQVGKTYAICPGRGKNQVARYKLLGIRREDVRTISLEDAIAEGFQNQIQFWAVWTSFYEIPSVARMMANYADRTGGHPPHILKLAHTLLAERPRELYDAWALNFELVK